MFLIYYDGESRKERERVDSLEHSLLVIDNTLTLVKILVPDVCKVVLGNSTIPYKVDFLCDRSEYMYVCVHDQNEGSEE